MKEEHQSLAMGRAWRYVKAAFWARLPVPALGRVPANVLGVLGLGILGLGEPGFWLLGLGLETTYLFSMTFNRRFQRSVDAMLLEGSQKDVEAKRQSLVQQLPQDSRKRLAELEDHCQRALDINRQNDDLATGTNREALARLQWVYLKLLVARNNLLSAGATESDADLARKVSSLEADLRNGIDAESLRQSKAATLDILRERLGNVRRRQESLEEIDSDLMRIEAQVQLLIENASIQGKSHTVSMDLELASNLANSLFGDSAMAITDLDQTYGQGRGRDATRQRS